MSKRQGQAIILFSFLCMLMIFAFRIKEAEAQEVDPNSAAVETSSEGGDGTSAATPNHQEEATGQPRTIPDQTQREADKLPIEYTGTIKVAKKLSIKQGDRYALKATLSGQNLSGKKIKYQSSNKKIVTVSAAGEIKALHWGEASVTLTLGKAEAVCKITVTEDITITISAAGDCTLSSDINQYADRNFFSVYNKQKKDGYFLQNVKPIFEKDDMTIVNFEGTLSSRGSRVDKKWAFRGKPSYINILTKGSVEAVAFANNHVRDYGEISYTDTIDTFKKADIVYSSYRKIGIYETKGKKIGMISIQEVGVAKDVYEKILTDALKEIKSKKVDLIIVSFHWGIERTSIPTKAQVDLSRMAIDGGANLVLGHHPHVLQPIEKYKNAYIVYSLGNFCFGGNTNPPDKDTMIYQQTFSFHNDKFVPGDDVRIIPCSVSSVSSKNDYQPTPSKGSEKQRIIKKINGYSKKYGIVFDGNGKITTKK